MQQMHNASSMPFSPTTQPMSTGNLHSNSNAAVLHAHPAQQFGLAPAVKQETVTATVAQTIKPEPMDTSESNKPAQNSGASNMNMLGVDTDVMGVSACQKCGKIRPRLLKQSVWLRLDQFDPPLRKLSVLYRAVFVIAICAGMLMIIHSSLPLVCLQHSTAPCVRTAGSARAIYRRSHSSWQKWRPCHRCAQTTASTMSAAWVCRCSTRPATTTCTRLTTGPCMRLW